MATTTGPRSPADPAADTPGAAQASLTGLAATIIRSARDIVRHTLEVAALESRLAGLALAAIVGAGIGVLVLLLSAWGLLLAAGVGGLMEWGLGVGAALLLAAAANLVLALLLGLAIPRLARRLTFAGTRRVLRQMRSRSGS